MRGHDVPSMQRSQRERRVKVGKRRVGEDRRDRASSHCALERHAALRLEREIRQERGGGRRKGVADDMWTRQRDARPQQQQA